MSKLCSKLALFALVTVLVLDASVVLAGVVASSETAAVARECGVASSVIDHLDESVTTGAMFESEGMALLEALSSACKEGLPLPPFEAKLLEGLAKRIPPLRIVSALDSMRQQYGSARDILSAASLANADAVSIMGDGITKGVPATIFKAYTETYSGQASAAFLNGLAMTSFLSQAGFDYTLTSSILDSGFEADSLTDQWRYLVRVVLVARKRGIEDEEVADAAKASLSGNGSLADVASALGFTLRNMSGRSISN